jgi:ribulose-5-phosphate 4-epimerase/fuculose-1-phosphate aldolase
MRKDKIDQAGTELLKLCRLVSETGLVSGVGRNISIRMEDRIYTTQTGCSLRDIREEEIVCVDMDGNVLTGGKPTKDIGMHLGILGHRADISVVLHVHGPHIIAASALMAPGEDTLPPLTPGFVYFAHPLVMTTFLVPGSKELTRAATDHFSGSASRALLLQNHGLVTVGKDIREALNIAEEIDEAAKIFLFTKGKGKKLSEEDINLVREL